MASNVAPGSVVSDALLEAQGASGQPTFTARQRIVAFARHCATVAGSPAPSVFRADPDSPTALVDVLLSVPAQQCTIDSLGTVWEQLLDSADRRAQGAHFTPRAVADRVAELAFDLGDHNRAVPKVWDPACGGGAFLIAAARWLEAHTAHERSSIVARLYASDIDATALDVCDAALELWAAGAARPNVVVADALLDLPQSWPPDFDVVIGNPPFLGQLTSDTTRSDARRRQLVDSYRSASGTYVDEAGVFVELSLQRTSADATVALVVPESILGARDAESMRQVVHEDARLARLWIDEGQSFNAAVDVVALILSRGPSNTASSKSASTDIALGVADPPTFTTVATPMATSWAPLLAHARGVPAVSLRSLHTLADRALVTAGFRQHFYGIADAVSEAGASASGGHHPRLITSGAIEPLRSLWANKPVRFAGSRWEAPVLVINDIADDKVREWFAARLVPKILLASQTKVVEAIVDADGALVPSVPVISVEPADPADIWHLAAALSAPAVSAWMLSEAAGTGLSHDAIRLRAATLATVPMPHSQVDWDAGARYAQRAHDAQAHNDGALYRCAMGDLAQSMNSAYGVGEHVGSWWWERIRLPPG